VHKAPGVCGRVQRRWCLHRTRYWPRWTRRSWLWRWTRGWAADVPSSHSTWHCKRWERPSGTRSKTASPATSSVSCRHFLLLSRREGEVWDRKRPAGLARGWRTITRLKCMHTYIFIEPGIKQSFPKRTRNVCQLTQFYDLFIFFLARMGSRPRRSVRCATCLTEVQ